MIFNPYVGPRPFTREDVANGRNLYGRDWEVEELLNLLISKRIVLLYSPSGAGKTSLIEAKMIQRLEQEAFIVLPVIRVNQEGWAADVDAGTQMGANRYILSTLQALESRFTAEDQLPRDVLATLALDKFALDKYLKQRHPTDPRTSQILIFDQFEEVLTIDPVDHEVKAEFFRQVGTVLRHPERWGLFSMREDFVPGLDLYLRLIPTRLNATFRLDLLEKPAALEAIQRPTEKVAVTFTDEAAENLVKDLSLMHLPGPDGKPIPKPGLYVEPVVLQVVCAHLWEKLAGAKRIETAHLQLIGDVDRALADFYGDKVREVAQQTGERERAIREWFERHLITGQGLRGQVLQEPERSKDLDNRVIKALIDAHLVRGEQRRGLTWFELAHDRLIEPIVANNKAWFSKYLRPFQRLAPVWESLGRPEHLLMADDDLRQAREWADAHDAELTPLDHEFLTISEGKQEERRRRMEVALAQTVAAYALRQHKGGKPDELVALLARQAFCFHQRGQGSVLDQVDEALRTVLSKPYFSAALRGHQDSVLAVAWSPDGQRLASGSRDSTLRLWDVHEPGPEGQVRYSHAAPVNAVAFSPDGQLLASGSDDATVRLWDIRQPEAEPRVLRGHQDSVLAVAWSPDGQWLASGSRDGTIRLWNVHQPDASEEPLRSGDAKVTSVTFSPTGRMLASGSDDGAVRLWDLHQDKPIPVVLYSHEGSITAIGFSPDGTLLASGSKDKTVRFNKMIYQSDLRLPSAPIVLDSHEGAVTAVVFNPDGRTLASGSEDTTVRTWTRTEVLADLVCKKVWRNLTLAEWRQFIGVDVPYERTCPNLPSGEGAPPNAPPAIP
jgi:Tol biopolymer transport system component